MGCGTGTLIALIAKRTPGARLIGIDPDPEVLERARRKLASAKVELLRGCAREADIIGQACADKVVSILVFHQTPVAEKRTAFQAMFRALRAGGELRIADYGLQRAPLMRILFRQVQRLDGFENTEPNAKGVLPELMREAGLGRRVPRRGDPDGFDLALLSTQAAVAALGSPRHWLSEAIRRAAGDHAHDAAPQIIEEDEHHGDEPPVYRAGNEPVADQLRPKLPKLAALMDDAEADVLAYMSFPKEHRAKLHSTLLGAT